MADESTTYLEDLVDLDDDDLEALTTVGPLEQRRREISADEARSQGRRKSLTVPEHFEGRDFKEDDDLEILANQLIHAHETTLGHCRNLRIAYLWKKKGGGKGGKGTLGKCQSLSGVAQYWGRADILIWLAADHCKDLQLGSRQLEALLFLYQIGTRETACYRALLGIINGGTDGQADEAGADRGDALEIWRGAAAGAPGA